MKLGPYELGYNDTNQGIYTGDARPLCEELPDESIDLIFTDPVYQNIEDYRWLAEMATRVLKPTGAMLTFFGIGYIQDTLQALANGGMLHRWVCAVFVPGAGSRIAQRVFGNWQALAWCGGDPLHHMCDAVISRPATLSGNHRWKKNLSPLIKFIEGFTDPDGLVLDPFTGGGTVPAACKMLSRPYLAFEINPQTATIAQQRLVSTPIPLPLITPTQPNLL